MSLENSQACWMLGFSRIFGGLACTSFSLQEMQPSQAWVVLDGVSRHRAQPRAVCSRANGYERLVAPKLEGINVEWNVCQPTRLC